MYCKGTNDGNAEVAYIETKKSPRNLFNQLQLELNWLLWRIHKYPLPRKEIRYGEEYNRNTKKTREYIRIIYRWLCWKWERKMYLD